MTMIPSLTYTRAGEEVTLTQEGPSMTEREQERAAIVAWLRQNSRAMLPDYAEVILAFADAIEAGDHLK